MRYRHGARAMVFLSLLGPLQSADVGQDLPNPIEHQRWVQRQLEMDRARQAQLEGRPAAAVRAALSGTGKILVILVEFGGTDQFTFTPSGPNASTWDPIGKADKSEWAGKVGDCSVVASKNKITGPTTYTYSGPLHNQIDRPLSATDASSSSVWAEDFNADYYQNMIFGSGVQYKYTRQDGTSENEDLRGTSVRQYFQDMSFGQYDLDGKVYGWVQVPHSVMWYGADPCPGRNSSPHLEAAHNGGIPGAGSARTLVKDALDATKKQFPAINWNEYDADHDGMIDHLWIVAAGVSESSLVLSNRTAYGEGAIWDHSASVTPAYQVTSNISAGHYIMMTEAVGMGTFVHEYGHDLGAVDLYSYGGGTPSPGFWAVQSDDWVGNPITAQPPAIDPWHLDFWGWLNPLVISDPSKEYVTTIGQTSQFPGGSGMYRGVRIQLQDGRTPLPVQPLGAHDWWSGRDNLLNAKMTLAKPVQLPASGPLTLSFSAAYATEASWDFAWIQVSSDNGNNWTTLTNDHTTCTHDPGWIGGLYAFPVDLCAAKMGGFTGKSSGWPNFTTEAFDLTAFAGKQILVRFWYMTDWNTTDAGVFLDNIQIAAGTQSLFDDDAETGEVKWTYQRPWEWGDGTLAFTHSYFLQWRNTGAGTDKGLANPNWRFGPTDSGLLVWYNNNYYSDNEIQKHLFDPPSFGPKGKLLLVESHPEPYRDPDDEAKGFHNEGANLLSRMQMRDAPFSQSDGVAFTMRRSLGYTSRDETFPARTSVKAFSDAVSYYPGAELVGAGPSSTTPQWVTKQWDSSVVLPSKVPYGMKAPGFLAGQDLLFNCANDTTHGNLNCDRFGLTSTVDLNGGSGNPRDVGGEYGWNVEILSQTSTQATVRIWNSRATAPTISAVVNAFGTGAGIAPNTWVVITGLNLAKQARTWAGADFVNNLMPTSLDGVSVTMNGKKAYVYYISATQLNILTPPDLAPGPVQVQVTSDGVLSAPFAVQVGQYAPAFFTLGGTAYVTGIHQDGSLLGPSTLYPGVSTPARPGEVVTLYLNGFGPTSVPVVSGSSTQSGTLPTMPEVRIGSSVATVSFAGLVSPGLYQFNVLVPESTADGEQSISATYRGQTTQSGLLLAVHR